MLAPAGDGRGGEHRRDNRPMLKMATRFLLLRFLPRRLLPIVTVAEALLLLRSVRNRSRTRVSEPTTSRTAPPPPVPGSTRSTDA